MKKMILIIFIMLSFTLHSQSDKDSDQHKVFAYFISFKQDEAKKYITDHFLNSDSKSRQVIGYVHLAQYYEYTELGNNKKQIESLNKAKIIASETNNEIDNAYVAYGFALYYKSIGRWDLFVKSFWESVNTFKSYPDENLILARLYMYKYKASTQNSLDKTDFSGYQKALDYAIKSKNKILISCIYTDIGTYYIMQKKDVDTAKYYYEKSYETSKEINDIDVKAALSFYYYSNIGAIYNSTNEYDKALHYLNLGVNSVSNNDYFYLCSYYNNIGSVYVSLEKYDLALENFLKAEAYSLNKGITNTHKITITTNIANSYEKLHQYDKAIHYLKKVKDAIAEEGKRRYEFNSQSLENFYKTEEEKIVLANKNKAYEKQKKYLFGLIFLGIFSSILLIYILYNRQKMNRRHTQYLESEAEKLKIEKELADLKQEHYQKQVLATSIQLEQKNKFLEELKDNISSNKEFNISNYLKQEQFIDKNLSNIHQIVKEVHPNFFKRLSEVSKNKLTNLDIKYATYIYMHMDNTQIATLLNVDPKTVSVTKYRLKLKLDIPKDVDLDTFIRNLN